MARPTGRQDRSIPYSGEYLRQNVVYTHTDSTRKVEAACGEDLAEYEDCWPAEAVTRDSLINQRRHGGGAINEGDVDEVEDTGPVSD